MTAPKYTRPAGSQSAVVYKCNIDAMGKVFERMLVAFHAHEQDSGSPAPDMTVRVEAGQIVASYGSPSERALIEVPAQTVSGFTIPSAGQHRIDRVVINESTGAASRVAGTAVTGSPSAAPPAIPAGTVPCCRVLIQDTDTAITNSMITDERSFGDLTRGMLRACDAAYFTDSQYARIAGSPSALQVANSKKGTFFTHLQLLGAHVVSETILSGGPASGSPNMTVRIFVSADDKISIQLRNPSGAIVLDLESVSAFVESPTWLTVLASWDLGGGGSPSGVAWLRVQDQIETDVDTMVDSLIDYAAASYAVAAQNTNGLGVLDGSLAELWFAPGQYIEDTEANRRKFYNASGKPMHLGARGERPTGTAPLIYLHLDDGEAPANFLIDRSGNGNTFTLVAGSPVTALQTASTSPSD